MKRRLQIFISSTYTDLKAERQAAVSAILKAGHIPAGMELFTAGDKSQMETIKQWIDESDAYMLILGGRYGSLEPSSGKSYTELEYDYAIEQGKPHFSVVIEGRALEEKVRENGTAYMERENPKELARFHEKVLGNISSFFEDEKDIKLCVHSALTKIATNRMLKGWIRADEIVDAKPLIEEIRKLSDDNQKLKAKLGELKEKKSLDRWARNESLDDLKQLLQSIEIDIPENVSTSTQIIKSNLLDIFYFGKEAIINGITNLAGMAEWERFMYFTVLPKLQIHGVVLIENVSGVKCRRYKLTKLGTEFLAYIDRIIIMEKAEKKVGLPSSIV